MSIEIISRKNISSYQKIGKYSILVIKNKRNEYLKYYDEK